MHMDREPLEPLQIPSHTGVWNELGTFMKEQYKDPLNIKYPIKQSKISVPGSLSVIKKFVETYLIETGGVQNVVENGKNAMTIEILKIIKFMLIHGFYANLLELKEVALPMINLMNGSNDMFCDPKDEAMASSLDEFLSTKRYFSSGNNDIIVQSKALLCENLIIISQLEIDGKVLVFLSKFKSDLDMLNLQRAISAQTSKIPSASKKAELEPAKKEKKGIFGNFGKNFKMPLGKVAPDKPNKISSKQIEKENVDFLNLLSHTYNFERDN